MSLMGGAGALLAGCGSEAKNRITGTERDGGLGGGNAPIDASAAVESGIAPDGGGLCIVRPQQTEGPYFVDEMLQRADIRSDPATGSVKDGALLKLTFHVHRSSGSACMPLAAALVDVWQCDASGVYSDVLDANGLFDTRGTKALRGYLLTDAAGIASFTTIYPGWYAGRTVHVHFKVRTPVDGGPAFAFTSQLYFDDALTDKVMAQPPYNAKGARSTRNTGDSIFLAGGDQLVLQCTPDGGGAYAADFRIGVQTP